MNKPVVINVELSEGELQEIISVLSSSEDQSNVKWVNHLIAKLKAEMPVA